MAATECPNAPDQHQLAARVRVDSPQPEAWAQVPLAAGQVAPTPQENS